MMIKFLKSLFKRKIFLKQFILDDISNASKIKCRISTPQFSPYGYTMFSQRGIFFKDVLKFYPYNPIRGHVVMFQSVKDFKDSVVEVYEVIY